MAADSRHAFEAVKVFSCTLAGERERLGERVSAWLANQTDVEVVDQVVTQSSDAAHHCIAITLFYRRRRLR